LSDRKSDSYQQAGANPEAQLISHTAHRREQGDINESALVLRKQANAPLRQENISLEQGRVSLKQTGVSLEEEDVLLEQEAVPL